MSRITEQGCDMTTNGMCLNQRTASFKSGQDATEEAEIQALKKDEGGNVLCPRSSLMSDCGIPALTPHCVSSSVPAIASDTMLQLAQALWAIRDILQ